MENDPNWTPEVQAEYDQWQLEKYQTLVSKNEVSKTEAKRKRLREVAKKRIQSKSKNREI